MSFKILTRFIALSLLASSTLLASCGSGSIKNPFVPTRVVVFGDALSDQTSGAMYTVNDAANNTTSNWTTQIAASYGVTTASIVSYAKGNAPITAGIGAGATGAVGASVTSVKQQVANFLAVDSFKSGDLVVINAGLSDLIAEAATTNSTVNAASYATAYANVIRSIVGAGALHVAAANVHDLSRTPAASIVTNLGIKGSNSRGALVAAFNDTLKINLGSTALTYIGDNVRLIDAEYYMDLVIGLPTSYSFVDATTLACNSIDAGAGIGLGAGQVNSNLCTSSTISTSATSTAYNTLVYNNYVFADAVYPTPAAHRALGSYAYSLLVARW